MPTPRKNEKKSDYIGRCVKQVMGEGKSQDDALGQCYGMWDEHKKNAKGSIQVDGDEVLFGEENTES